MTARLMKNGWRSPIVGAGLIMLLTVLAYLPVMRGGFIWDDDVLITDNRMIKARDGLRRFWFTTEAGDYYPLTSSLYWVEWRLWAGQAAGYHVVNVLLHTGNALLVWMILRRLKVPGAWLAGCVFALHPVNVATVAWISEQKNTLSMLWYGAAILLYLRFDEEGGWRWYSLSLAAFLLALVSKTAVVMLPVVLLGCVWWLRGRVRWKDFLCSLPFFVASLLLGLATVWFQQHRALLGHQIRTVSLAYRIAAAGWVPWFYLYKALLPFDLNVFYPKWSIDESQVLSYLPGVALVGGLLLFWWKRRSWGRAWFFALGCFVATLFPVLGFFEQGFYGFSLVADHWQYLAIPCVIGLTVAAGVTFCGRMGKWRQSGGVLASVAVLATLGVATWNRSCVYADNESLWRDTLAKNPGAWAAWSNLGLVLAKAGKLPEAIADFEEALRIEPDYAEAHNNLAHALSRVGRIQDAIRHYEQALQINPYWAVAHNNLGNALRRVGRVDEAISQYEQAVRLDPELAAAHYDLAVTLKQVGRVDEAIRHYQEAVRIDPDLARAQNNLGNALLQSGKIEEAIGHLEQAIRIAPGYVEAYNNLGNALLLAGNVAEAVRQYQRALQIAPNDAAAHYNLGMLLADQGKGEEAISHLRSAVKLQPASKPFAQALEELERRQAAEKRN